MQDSDDMHQQHDEINREVEEQENQCPNAGLYSNCK